VAEKQRGTRTDIGGILDSAEAEGWGPVHPIAANATPSGKVTAEAWAELKGGLTKAARDKGPFNGIYLALHGAMVTETTMPRVNCSKRCARSSGWRCRISTPVQTRCGALCRTHSRAS
tara:strand:- start:475 stop:828 length:354 start_codon:yes stop_codon:yes gene_type:complete